MHTGIYTGICECMHACTYTHAYTFIYMYTRIHTYIHTCMHAWVHTYIHTYIHTYMHTCAYIHTHIRTLYIHTYIPTYLHTYLLTYFHSHACMHAYIHTYSFISSSHCVRSTRKSPRCRDQLLRRGSLHHLSPSHSFDPTSLTAMSRAFRDFWPGIVIERPHLRFAGPLPGSEGCKRGTARSLNGRAATCLPSPSP